MFDFDRVIERRGTHASKWDNMAKLSGIDAPDAIPMWVADMDFAAPPGVTEALDRRGPARRARLLRRHRKLGRRARGLDGAPPRPAVDPAWVSPTPGIVSGLGLILQARDRARRRGRGVPARLSRLPQDHRLQRAAHSRCTACRDRRPLRDGFRCAAQQADAANQGRLPVQPAQSRRHRLAGRRASRAGRLSAPSTT